MKHPPKFLWVAICMRCGEVAGALRRQWHNPTCSNCPVDQNHTVKMARYRLVTAPGAEK